MNQQLCIGITELTPAWRTLLDQIGVDYTTINTDQPDLHKRFSCIILSSPLTDSLNSRLSRYLEAGGALLDAADYIEHHRIGHPAVTYQKSIIPDQKDQQLFSLYEPLDLYGQCKIYPEGRHLEQSVYISENDSSHFAAIGFDIDKALMDTKSVRKSFYTPAGSPPDEKVSRISKAGIRRIVTKLLHILHQKRSLPFIHKWMVPHGKPYQFCFRVDTDYGSESSIRQLYNLARDYQKKLSWFLHVEAHRDWLELFRQFTGQEIAVHGYRHKTYWSHSENYVNLTDAMKELNRTELEYSGFCAPYGLWNPGLQRAIEEHGFTYSSEFSLNYDDLPFFPQVSGRKSSALQVPIHPVCTGSFYHLEHDTDAINCYFDRLLAERKAAYEPILLYDHPMQNNPDVIEHLFQQTNGSDIYHSTIGEYADWWLRRNNTSFSAEFDDAVVTIQSAGKDDSVKWGARTAGGEVKLIDTGSTRLDSATTLPSHPRPEPVSKHQLATLRGFKPEHLKKSILHFIHRLGS